MNFVFRKMSRYNETDYDNNFILKDDFKLSLLYLAIYSKFTNKSRKILPSDLNKVDAHTLKLLFTFMNLKRPFDRYEMEAWINDKKKLSSRQYQQVCKVYEQRLYKGLRPQELEIKKKHFDDRAPLNTKLYEIKANSTIYDVNQSISFGNNTTPNNNIANNVNNGNNTRYSRTPGRFTNSVDKYAHALTATNNSNNTNNTNLIRHKPTAATNYKAEYIENDRKLTDGIEEIGKNNEKKEVVKKEDSKSLNIVNPKGEKESWDKIE